MKIAIMGAGPSGLSCSVQFCSPHCGVDVFEASETVGGLARSARLWNQTVDLGPHRFFSRNKRVNQFWLDVVGSDFSMVNRRTRILYRNQFYNYPLQPKETVTKLGPFEASQCLASYVRERIKQKSNDDSLEHWICQRFGRRLSEKFFRPYNEKLWGIPCSEVDADFATQRIRQFSLGAAIKRAFRRKRSSLHRTLVDQFAYPNGGTGTVYERMAKAIEKRGGHNYLNTPVEAVLTENNRVTGIRVRDGTIRDYDWVVSTMPLTALVKCLPEVPESVRSASRQLTFRSTILVYLEVADSNLFPDQWIYLHSPELQSGRVTNFRNWSPTLYGDSLNTILAMEYWCNDGEGLWLWDDARLIDLAAREILSTGLVKGMDLIKNGAVYRIPKSYPVYRKGYKNLLRPIQEYLNSIRGLQVIGRYGSFKYNNQDHSILMGLLAADNILKNAGNDLWSVNSDYDTYQEGYRITETGLVRDTP